MSRARVKRSAGPKRLLTENNYRKWALPHLLNDFSGRCAYCLDPNEFRHPREVHVEHFNCKMHGRKKHRYRNLMLACCGCNYCKLEKPISNPLDREQRFLNCTEENEFPDHLIEARDGKWIAKTKAGHYHLESIGLNEDCHAKKRAERRKVAEKILEMCTVAIQYQTANPAATQEAIKNVIFALLENLKNYPPLVTATGLMSIRTWLQSHGVDLSFLAPEGGGRGSDN